MPIPEAQRINPQNLRVECQRCGGHGHILHPLRSAFFGGQPVTTGRLPCPECSGRGWNKPRRPIR